MQELIFAHIVHPSNIDILKSAYDFENMRDTYGDPATPTLGSTILHMKTLVDHNVGSEVVDTVVVFLNSDDMWVDLEVDDRVQRGPFGTFIALKRKN